MGAREVDRFHGLDHVGQDLSEALADEKILERLLVFNLDCATNTGRKR